MPSSYSLIVPQGWSLLGNSLNESLQTSSLFNDASWVISVWKWDTTRSNWQFYSPTLTATALAAYAAGKNYAVLSEIKAGEGYWVNAKAQKLLGIQSGTALNMTSINLASGWNLVATGTTITPSAFNDSLGAPLTSLWAWDASQSKWYFYAPSLDTGSALADYLSGHGYLDLTSSGKTLGNGVGFWVKRP